MAEIPTIYNHSTNQMFNDYLAGKPNNRRVTSLDAEDIIRWLTDNTRRPKDQVEHSRRNYIRKIFYLNLNGHLVNIGPTDANQHPERLVIQEHQISYYVDLVHKNNQHRGWDRTWEEVKAQYYGILRADVQFLVERCPYCLKNPTKNPKTNKGIEERRKIMERFERDGVIEYID